MFMKNCEEMVNSLFERKKQYDTSKKHKRKFLIHTLIPTFCVCIIALMGVAAHYEDLFVKQPEQILEDSTVVGEKDWYGPDEQEPPTTNLPQNSATADILGLVFYNGKQYVQTFDVSENDVVLDKKIGTGEDFDGTYNSKWCAQKYEETGNICYYGEVNVKSEIYTIKDNENLLGVVLDNGGFVILKAQN